MIKKSLLLSLMMLVGLAPYGLIIAQEAHPPKLERRKPPDEDQQKPDPKQGQKPQSKEDQETINLGADLVTFNMAVTDAHGRRLTNLKQDEVSIFEDGTKQQVSFFNTSEEPFHVVLLIDISGSTQQQIAQIQHAAKMFVNELKPGDEIAIVSFAEAPTLECDFTHDRGRLERSISRLTVPPPRQAGTSFYDSVRIMVEQVLGSVEGRKAFVALTDGVDSTSVASYDDALSFATSGGATGYFIQVDTEEFTLGMVMKNHIEDGAAKITPQQLRRYVAVTDVGDPSRYTDSDKLSPLERREVNTKLYEIARDELAEMANKSGGRVYPIDGLEGASDAFKQIADEIRLQYSVGYYPKPERHDGQWHKIRVEIKVPGAVVHTRPGYTAPKDAK